MHYRTEFTTLAVIAVLLVSVLLIAGYWPRTEAPGDDTPPEIEAGGETPPELRQP